MSFLFFFISVILVMLIMLANLSPACVLNHAASSIVHHCIIISQSRGSSHGALCGTGLGNRQVKESKQRDPHVNCQYNIQMIQVWIGLNKGKDIRWTVDQILIWWGHEPVQRSLLRLKLQPAKQTEQISFYANSNEFIYPSTLIFPNGTAHRL